MSSFKKFKSYRLVKSEDLNHHGTLFAGRSAEWFVESGFVAASHYLPPSNIICLKIHGMSFNKPIKLGQTIYYESSIVYAGKSSLIANIKLFLCDNEKDFVVDGYITFVHVNENTIPTPHNIIINPQNDDDKKIQDIAINLKNI